MEPAATDTAFVEIKLEGSTIGSALRVQVEDHDQWTDSATIVVDDPQALYLQAAREGMTLTVDLGWKEHAVIFEGVITQVSGVCTTGGRRETTLVAYDLSHLMQREKRTEDHVGDLSVILRKLIARLEYKGRIKEGQILVEKKNGKEPVYTERMPLRQLGLSDWVLIQSLAGKYQARAFVEFNEGASKFYWVPVETLLQTKTLGSLKYCQGFGKLIEFKPVRCAAGTPEKAALSLVDATSGEVLSTPPPPKPLPDPPPAVDPGTLARLDKISPLQGEGYRKAHELTAGAGENPADQRATGGRQIGASDPAALDEAHGANPAFKLGLVGTGTCVGTVGLRAKGKVAIYGVAPTFEGDWYLRRVHHRYTRELDADRKHRSTYTCSFVATR